MNVHFFDKIEFPCIIDWTIKQNAKKCSEHAIKSVLKLFHTENILDFFANNAEAIVPCEEVLNILKNG